jgi:hypothetical protein
VTTHGEVADEYLAAARKIVTAVHTQWNDLLGKHWDTSEALKKLEFSLSIAGHLTAIAHVSAIRAQTEDGGSCDV